MSGLNAAIQSAVTAAFGVAIDAGATVVAILHLGGTGAYNPESDTTTRTGVSDITVPDAILYKAKQTQGSSDSINRAMLVFALPEQDVDEADTVTIGGTIWNIEEVSPVPTKIVTILALRK